MSSNRRLRTDMSAGDLYLSASGSIDNKAEYGLYIVYYMLYGGRNILLASVSLLHLEERLGRVLTVDWNVHRPWITQGRTFSLEASSIQADKYEHKQRRRRGS